jgi:type VI secretion system protein ImpF
MVTPPSRGDFLPSALDRLLDDEPQATTDTRNIHGWWLNDLQERLKRDLEDLLNTRRRCVRLPPEATRLADSLINYGMPDLTTMNLVTDQDRERLRQMLQEVIERFEPRLARPRVTLLGEGEPLEQTLRFRIEGLFQVEPVEPVAFESALEPVSCNFTVKGESDGR